MDDKGSTQRVEEFFSCIASLMSLQLRSLIVKSLDEFLSFMEDYSVILNDRLFGKFHLF